MRLLRDYDNSEARALVLDAISNKDGIQAAIEYANSEEFIGDKLNEAGLLGLASKAAGVNDFEQAEALLATATNQQIENCPAILTVRAEMRIALCRPEGERDTTKLNIPLHPISVRFSDEPSKIELRNLALLDIDEFLGRYASQLDIPLYSEYIEDLALWLRLSHPENDVKTKAKEWLKAEVQKVEKAVRFARFAFDYGVEVDEQAILEYLDVRKRMGGWEFVETIAALLVSLRSKDHEQLLSLIRQERKVLVRVFEPIMLSSIEVEMLARSGDISGAESLITSMSKEYGDSQAIITLRNLVQEIAGGDALALRLASFQETGGDTERRMLIEELLDKDRLAEAAEHITAMFDNLPTVNDALRIARCHYNAANYVQLREFLERDDVHSLFSQSDDLQSYQAWSEYFSGDVNEALRILSPLRKRRNDENDRSLEINLYMESGNWEELHRLIVDDLENKEHRTAHDLLTGAEVGRVTGLAAIQIEALIDAAVEKAKQDNDVDMLTVAYRLIFSLGLEEKKTEVHEWMQLAVDLSGSDGPIKMGSIREFVDSAAQRRKHNDYVNDLITKAEAPLSIAAGPLNETLTNIIIGNFIANTGCESPGKKVGLPLFSGNRVFGSIKGIRTIAIDRSALMAFGFLGVLEKVFGGFERIIIARSTMSDFLQELTKVPFHQPSRVEGAKHIADHIAASRLHVLQDQEVDEDVCPNDVGESLQRLVCAAQQNNGIVIVSPPIYKAGSLLEEEVDSSGFVERVCGLQELIDFLFDESEFGEEESLVMRKDLLDDGVRWKSFGKLERNSVIYLDGLVVEKLERLGIVNRLSQVFKQLVIDRGVRDDAIALIEYSERQHEVEELIHGVRRLVYQGIKQGKVRLSPQTYIKRNIEQDQFDGKYALSLSQLLNDVGEAEAVVVDDRALNKLNEISFKNGQRKPLVTGVDILKTLVSEEGMSQEHYFRTLQQLRKAGALFVPIDREELITSVLKGDPITTQSFEIKAVADYIDFVRVRNILQLPQEMPWLGRVCLEILWAIRDLWITEQPVKIVEAACQRLLDILPDPYDWVGDNADESLLDWARLHYVIRITFLGDGLSIPDTDRRRVYLDWVESVVIQPMVKVDPSIMEDSKRYSLQTLSKITEEVDDEFESAI